MLDHFQDLGVSIAIVTGNDTFLKVNIHLRGLLNFFLALLNIMLMASLLPNLRLLIF